MAITFDDIKNLPPKRKALILVLLLMVLGYFYYYLFFQSLYEKKTNLDMKLSTLKQQTETKQMIVKEIEKSKKELVTLRESLQVALTKLPDRKEIPGLLSSLAKEGRASGLDFVHFEPLPPPPKPVDTKQDAKQKNPKGADAKTPGSPQAEVEKFYNEIPIKVILSGGFHDTVSFFEHVAKLPRIVNVADMTVEGDKDAKDDVVHVTTTCVMKTYVFMENPDEKKK